MERGEVYYLRYDDSYGHEQAIGRPVLIVSSQVGIDTSEVVTIAYLTSRYKQININVEISGTPRRSWVMCNQLGTVDKRRLQDKMCELTKSEMDEVDERICEALGIESVVKIEKVVEPTVVDDSEKTRLQIELDLYKKLYNDLTSQIVDARFERQVVVENKSDEEIPFVPKEEPVVEIVKPVEHLEEKPTVDVEKLKKQMSTPNDEMVEEEPEKKMGRPKGSKNKPKKLSVGRKVTPEDLAGFKKKGKVNVNTDSWEVIAATTGMGVQTAQEIVSWRKKNGAFIDLSDLLFVPRFGSGCMNKYGQMLEA